MQALSVQKTLYSSYCGYNCYDLDNIGEIVIRGSYLYGAVRNRDRVVVVNIASPTNPYIVRTYYHSYMDDAYGIDISPSGSHLYVKGYSTYYMTVLSLSNPASPTLVGYMYHSHLYTCEGFTVYAVNPNYVFCVSRYYHRFNVMDVSSPASPSYATSLATTCVPSTTTCTTSDMYNLYYPSAMAVRGTLAYVVTNYGRLTKRTQFRAPAYCATSRSLDHRPSARPPLR